MVLACNGAVWSFPAKPVRIVIGFPAGGPLDSHARLLADKLQAVLGQPVLIDYKAGAGGTVGAQDVMKSSPDGHTLMLANTGVMVINPALYARLPYSTLRDFVPIARTAMQPLALLVNPQLLMVHIPYRGSAPAFTDLMSGQVQFMAESIPQAAVYHKQGKVRALAVTGRERSPALPEVPTVRESGFKDFVVVGFYGFLAPAGTPKEAVEVLSRAFMAVLSQPEVRQRMVQQGAAPAFLGADDFRRFLSDEMPRWSEVVKKSGARVD